MRAENIEVIFRIPIPIDRPDKNGVVYTKQAIEKAMLDVKDGKLHGIPITFRDNSKTRSVVVGVTHNDYCVDWDYETQTCYLTAKGVIFAGGTDEYADTEAKKVQSFNIRCLGIGVEAFDKKAEHDFNKE